MLLVTFHGGSGGIANAYAYNTATNALISDTALANSPLDGDAELRAMVLANTYLYVVNGKKKESDVLCFSLPPSGSSTGQCEFVSTFAAATLSKKGHFEMAIAHPYSMVFNGPSQCFISNQDTNVVAAAAVAADSTTATVSAGCQSAYLNGITGFCPSTGCVYLDGTFVASQNGSLPDVTVTATNVPEQNGGLSIDFSGSADSQKVQNSVRDLALVGNVLLVCDEPGKVLRLYSLPEGAYLGASPVLAAAPTHLAVAASGLYVSAGSNLYWSALGASPTPASLSFHSVLEVPATGGYKKIGGVAFDAAGTGMYAAFQTDTGETGSGAIYSYAVTGDGSSAPVLSGASVFASALKDTPEFLLFVPD